MVDFLYGGGDAAEGAAGGVRAEPCGRQGVGRGSSACCDACCGLRAAAGTTVWQGCGVRQVALLFYI